MSDALLITGAGGFVGSAAVRLLVRAAQDGSLRFADGTPVGHVVAAARVGSRLERFQELSSSRHWSLVGTDLVDSVEFSRLLATVQPRVIIHTAVDAAAYRELSNEESVRVNLGPLQVMLDYLRGVPGARLIHTSSSWVLPAGEDLDETTPLQPWTPYAIHKAQQERFLKEVGSSAGVPWVCLRLFNIFGKYENPGRLLPYLVSALRQRKPAELSSGDNVRDFTDVDVIARSYWLALEADDAACGRIYHIGSGRGIRLRDFAMIVADITGGRNLLRFGAQQTPDENLRVQVANLTLAGRWLDWSPPRDVESDIGKAAEWWLERLGAPASTCTDRSAPGPASS